MPYRAPVEDFAFLFDHVVGLDAVRQTERFEDASEDVTRAILEEAGKMTNDVLAPLQRAGDQTPAKLENGVVRRPVSLTGSRPWPKAAGSACPPTLNTVAWACQ